MMKCKLCSQEMGVDVELTGGCLGHPPGNYCYCDSPDVHIEFICSTPKCKRYMKAITPKGLTDKYGLERFITKYYSKDDEAGD